MGGRGACDPNKFQILFPTTFSSCVQALRPFPTSPSFPFPEGLFPFTAWSPRATPAAGCERRECVSLCVPDTLGLFGGRVSAPSPSISPAAPIPSPHQPLIPWVFMVLKGDLFMAPYRCPAWPWEGVLEQVALPHPSPFSKSPLPFPPYNSCSRPGVGWGGLGEGARIRGMDQPMKGAGGE